MLRMPFRLGSAVLLAATINCSGADAPVRPPLVQDQELTVTRVIEANGEARGTWAVDGRILGEARVKADSCPTLPGPRVASIPGASAAPKPVWPPTTCTCPAVPDFPVPGTNCRLVSVKCDESGRWCTWKCDLLPRT